MSAISGDYKFSCFYQINLVAAKILEEFQ